eukprot:gene9381-11523_t
MKISIASLDDVEGIARVHSQSWEETYKGLIDDNIIKEKDFESRLILWKRVITENKTLTFVAKVGEEIVGFVNGGKERGDDLNHPPDINANDDNNNEKSEIYAIYVLQKVQRTGIGKQLVDTILKVLNERGFKSLVIWVLDIKMESPPPIKSSFSNSSSSGSNNSDKPTTPTPLKLEDFKKHLSQHLNSSSSSNNSSPNKSISNSNNLTHQSPANVSQSPTNTTTTTPENSKKYAPVLKKSNSEKFSVKLFKSKHQQQQLNCKDSPSNNNSDKNSLSTTTQDDNYSSPMKIYKSNSNSSLYPTTTSISSSPPTNTSPLHNSTGSINVPTSSTTTKSKSFLSSTPASTSKSFSNFSSSTSTPQQSPIQSSSKSFHIPKLPFSPPIPPRTPPSIPTSTSLNSSGGSNHQMENYTTSSACTTNSEDSNDQSLSEGGLTPESEHRLEEVSSRRPFTPRFTHESKSIPSEISLRIWESDAIGADFNEHQSFGLFRQMDLYTPIHKEKTLIELGLRDMETIYLKTVPLNIIFVKIQIPFFSKDTLAQATLKLTQFTSVRSIIRKLYLKFNHNTTDISQHGIFLIQQDESNQSPQLTTSLSLSSLSSSSSYSSISSTSSSFYIGQDHREILLEEDELFSSYNINPHSKLIFRTLSHNTDNDIILSKSLKLKILISTKISRYNHLTLMFDPTCTVSKAIKITGLRTGLLDSLNKCGFYLTPSDDDDDGFWMDEDLTLESYRLKNFTVLEFKERCRKYIVSIKPDDRKCTFKFDQFVKVSALFQMMVSNESVMNPRQYCLAIKDGQVLDLDRYLWSYDIGNRELEFKEIPNRLVLFGQNGEQNSVLVDFNDPIEDVCRRLSINFGYIPPAIGTTKDGAFLNNTNGGPIIVTRERGYTLKRLGQVSNATMDMRKSLKSQGVQPNEALILEVVQQKEIETNQSSEETTPASTPPIVEEENNTSTAATVTTANQPTSNNNEELVEQNQVNIWLEPPDSPENIIYNTTNKRTTSSHSLTSSNSNNHTEYRSIEAGTLNKLIIRLTSENTHDLMFMKTLLMTYTSYTNSTTLLKKLFERFQVPPGIDEKERLSIQLRVCNVIKYWVEHHYEDFGYESTKLMVDFVDTHMMIAFPSLGNQIRGCILKRTCGMKNDLVRSNGALTQPRSSSASHLMYPSGSSGSSNNLSTSSMSSISSLSSSLPLSSPRKCPESKIKGIKDPHSLFDFDDEEIARQLTLYEFMLYSSIKPTEFLNQAWNKPLIAARKSPTILQMISRFNDVGLWVVKLILEPDRVKTRAKRMERIIKIAEKLRELKNYNTLMSFIGGLNNSAILRLKYTKALVSKKYLDILENLEREMSCDGAYKIYRELLHHTDPPCVPYIGVYLTDLTFIEDGNPNIIGNNLINFSKYTLLYKVISEVQTYQWSEYNLNYVPIIHTFIKDLSPPTASELYQLSLQKEPKEWASKGVKFKVPIFTNNIYDNENCIDINHEQTSYDKGKKIHYCRVLTACNTPNNMTIILPLCKADYKEPFSFTSKDSVILFAQFGMLKNGYYDITVNLESIPTFGDANNTGVQMLTCIDDEFYRNSYFNHYCDNLPSCSFSNNLSLGINQFSEKARFTGFYYFLITQCSRQKLSYQVEYALYNPGGNHLSYEKIPLPILYMVFVGIWAVLTFGWGICPGRYRHLRKPLALIVSVLIITLVLGAVFGKYFTILSFVVYIPVLCIIFIKCDSNIRLIRNSIAKEVSISQQVQNQEQQQSQQQQQQPETQSQQQPQPSIFDSNCKRIKLPISIQYNILKFYLMESTPPQILEISLVCKIWFNFILFSDSHTFERYFNMDYISIDNDFVENYYKNKNFLFKGLFYWNLDEESCERINHFRSLQKQLQIQPENVVHSDDDHDSDDDDNEGMNQRAKPSSNVVISQQEVLMERYRMISLNVRSVYADIDHSNESQLDLSWFKNLRVLKLSLNCIPTKLFKQMKEIPEFTNIEFTLPGGPDDTISIDQINEIYEFFLTLKVENFKLDIYQTSPLNLEIFKAIRYLTNGTNISLAFNIDSNEHLEVLDRNFIDIILNLDRGAKINVIDFSIISQTFLDLKYRFHRLRSIDTIKRIHLKNIKTPQSFFNMISNDFNQLKTLSVTIADNISFQYPFENLTSLTLFEKSDLHSLNHFFDTNQSIFNLKYFKVKGPDSLNRIFFLSLSRFLQLQRGLKYFKLVLNPTQTLSDELFDSEKNGISSLKKTILENLLQLETFVLYISSTVYGSDILSCIFVSLFIESISKDSIERVVLKSSIASILPLDFNLHSNLEIKLKYYGPDMKIIFTKNKI